MIHFTFAWYVIYKARIYMKSDIPKERKKFMKIYTINLAVYSIFSFTVVLYYMMSSGIIPVIRGIFEIISIISSLFGTAINLARLYDPSIRKRLKYILKDLLVLSTQSRLYTRGRSNAVSFADLDPSVVGLFLDLHIEVVFI